MEKRFIVGPETARRLRQGHPWVLADRFTAGWPGSLDRGAVISLVDEQGTLLGTALLDPGEKIVARLLDSESVRLTPDWLKSRVQKAERLRTTLIDRERTDVYRLINGEGDQLPGLTLDRFGDHLLLQTYTDSWLPHLGKIGPVLAEVFAPSGIIHKRRPQKTRELKDLKEDGVYGQLLLGQEPSSECRVSENQVNYAVDLQHGLHTGLFLDQRDNRAWVRGVAEGRRVLNLFSYTGSFSVVVSLGGARQTTSVDLSGHYLELARQNFGLNHLNPKRHRFIQGECAEVSDRLLAAGEKFDLILLDPPSFSTSKKGRFSVRNQTAEMVARSLRLLESGGLLLACSNLAKFKGEDYLRQLQRGAVMAGCGLQIVAQRGQGVDFPFSAAFEEGNYLKFFVGRKLE